MTPCFMRLAVLVWTLGVTWYRVDSRWNADLLADIDVWIAPHGFFIVDDEVAIGVKEHRRETIRLLVRYASFREVPFRAVEAMFPQESRSDSLVSASL